MTPLEQLRGQLKALRLPSAAQVVAELADKAQREGWPAATFAHQLLAHELEGRRQRRVERLAAESRLPIGKTRASLREEWLPFRLRQLLPSLYAGDFVDRAENILVFGLPGRGKTHLVAAVGHALVQAGRSVYFSPTYQLVGRLLRAKRDLALDRELRRLDRFEVVIVDDIGYVQQSREEMEVLFTFLAERYERRSVVITSNLVFSEWDRIFKDPMTTAAAIDRVVHHALILEFGSELPSVRAEAAAERNRAALAAAPPRQPAPPREIAGAQPDPEGGQLAPDGGQLAPDCGEPRPTTEPDPAPTDRPVEP
jgi:DNA replication protein DnaC